MLKGELAGAVDCAKGKVMSNSLGQKLLKSLNIKSLPTKYLHKNSTAVTGTLWKPIPLNDLGER